MNKNLQKQLSKARHASYEFNQLSTSQKNKVLVDLANNLWNNRALIIKANHKDFADLPSNYPLTDRLQLTEPRIKSICDSLRAVVKLKDPIGEVLEKKKRPSGITVSKVRVPIGVLGVIYEARPNVTIEIFSLSLKSGNAIILKGSRDAYNSNLALVKYIKQSLKQNNLDSEGVQLIDPFNRDLTKQLLHAHDYIDIVIPRGSDKLIQFVRNEASVPVIETGAGVCHTYIEKTADMEKAVQVSINAKVRRCTVCNALDCLVIDKLALNKFLPTFAKEIQKHQVIIYADPASYKVLAKTYPEKLLQQAKPQHYGKEFLAMKLSIKTVDGFDEAVNFIQEKTSGHSEAIMTTNKKKAGKFTKIIDAAAVYVNTSTAFTDGFEFGLGAEVGISTQKLHARGPMGLQELTTYKWLISSNGQIRSS
ncbi:MAG: glutamate-5-semialdehyde dehydrogenase [bacterium]|nr:glutamate-5-semialdehyde dehydrogenase [bacterium]